MSTPASAAVASARQLIESTDFANNGSIDEIGASVRFTSAGEQAARDVIASSAETDVLWAALWVYASAGSDPAVVRPLIDNADPSIRAMAAATMVALGDASGFDALNGLIGDETQLLGSHPPLSIREYVIGTFERYIAAAGTPTPPQTAEELGPAALAWSTWLGQNAPALHFDAADGTWKL